MQKKIVSFERKSLEISTFHLFVAGRGELALRLGQDFAGSRQVEVLDWVGFFGEHLNRRVLVDCDGSTRDEDLLCGSVVLEHCHDAGLEDGQGWNVFGQDTEGAAEGWHVDLSHIRAVVENFVGSGQGEAHFVGIAASLHGTNTTG